MARVSDGCETLQDFRSAREVKRLADREEVADLMHFHGSSPRKARHMCLRPS